MHKKGAAKKNVPADGAMPRKSKAKLGRSESGSSSDSSLSKSSMTLTEQVSMESVATIKLSAEEDDPVQFIRSRGYKQVKAVGEGGYATVYKAVNAADNQTHAIKLFQMAKMDKNWVKNCLKMELFVSKTLKHPNIILTINCQLFKKYALLVMVFAVNGSIKNEMYVVNKCQYEEKDAKAYFRGLMTGLAFMHGRNTAHRDLKLDNFLLSEDKTPMLSDFGFARNQKVPSEQMKLTTLMRKTVCGTPGYMAPELLTLKAHMMAEKKQPGNTAFNRRYDAKAVDMFAMGISLYEMLNYSIPQDPSNIGTLDVQGHLSGPCQALMDKLLKMSPKDRPTAEETLKDAWLSSGFFG